MHARVHGSGLGFGESVGRSGLAHEREWADLGTRDEGLLSAGHPEAWTPSDRSGLAGWGSRSQNATRGGSLSGLQTIAGRYALHHHHVGHSLTPHEHVLNPEPIP